MRAFVSRSLVCLGVFGLSCFSEAPTVTGQGDSTSGDATTSTASTRTGTGADTSSGSSVDTDVDGSTSTTQSSTGSSGPDPTTTSGEDSDEAGSSEASGGVVDPCVHHVFVTSDAWPGDLGDFTSADDKCTTVAQSAGEVGDWVAVLSGIHVDAADRFTVMGRVCDMNDQLIAVDAAQWWSDSHHKPINVTEGGDTLAPALWRVWSATNPDGSRVDGPASSCSNWTSADVVGPTFGHAQREDAWWIREDSGIVGSCNDEARLYCFR